MRRSRRPDSTRRSGGRPPTLAPPVQHLLRTLGGPPLRSCGPLPRAVTPCYFELPVARRLSSAVRALLPAGLSRTCFAKQRERLVNRDTSSYSWTSSVNRERAAAHKA